MGAAEHPWMDCASKSSCPEPHEEETGMIKPRAELAVEHTNQDGASSRSATRTPSTGQENTL